MPQTPSRPHHSDDREVDEGAVAHDSHTTPAAGDTVLKKPGSPDADTHVPAAAPMDTDSEAGDAGGGIEPLKRKD
ncbi:hypothetical protein SAMN05428963_106212 [Consotaella salsifontis]|uniref:Uncharacterized protein n=1 Tax=Consotaella salsifontis TaxID=1365950 RepID=A0A1T4RD22_9HYPH|nr:hypothetical protein SAMN05428963_106212 [Consotaella salsifontis]